MRITLSGSTGRTGCYVLTEGTRRSRQLTAVTRRPDILTDTSGLVRVVHGDGRDLIAIAAAASRKGPHRAAEILLVVTAAMVDAGVRRLVITSGTSAGADGNPLRDPPPLDGDGGAPLAGRFGPRRAPWASWPWTTRRSIAYPAAGSCSKARNRSTPSSSTPSRPLDKEPAP